jgi:phage replication-related protein YjqB (UPF0714/DUF867 family)
MEQPIKVIVISFQRQRYSAAVVGFPPNHKRKTANGARKDAQRIAERLAAEGYRAEIRDFTEKA